MLFIGITQTNHILKTFTREFEQDMRTMNIAEGTGNEKTSMLPDTLHACDSIKGRPLLFGNKMVWSKKDQ